MPKDQTDHSINSEGTPNPTIEEIFEHYDRRRKIREKLTPESFPHFSISPLSPTKVGEVTFAYCNFAQVDEFRAANIPEQSFSTQVDQPDTISFHSVTEENGAVFHSFGHIPTHFFVNMAGDICFEIPNRNSSNDDLENREIWILSESLHLSSKESAWLEGFPMAFPYARVRDAVRSRNEAWAIELPNRLKNSTSAKRPVGISKALYELAVADQIAWMSNHAHDRDFMRAMATHPEGFRRNDHEGHYYNKGKEGTTTKYQPLEILAEIESGLGNAPQRALDALDNRFKSIKSDLTADIVDILYHHWGKSGCTANSGPARITLSQICHYRGVKPEGDNLRITLHAVLDARSMRLQNNGVDDAILNISSIELDKLASFNTDISAHADTLFVYSPGFIVQWGLQGNLYFSAPFAQSLWSLSPKDHNEAKRIGRFLRGDWRMNTQKYFLIENCRLPTRWLSWESILRESGIHIEGHRTSNDPGRLIKRVEKAISKLYDMGVIAEGGFHIYHPDDRQFAENLPRKGKLEKWLTLRVCLAPAADIRDALRKTDANRNKRNAALVQAKANKSAGIRKAKISS